MRILIVVACAGFVCGCKNETPGQQSGMSPVAGAGGTSGQGGTAGVDGSTPPVPTGGGAATPGFSG
jgi:hypothetical protein